MTKRMLVLFAAAVLFVSIAASALAQDEEMDKNFIQHMRNCAASITHYDKFLKPYIAGKSKPGDADWKDLVESIRLDNGISCGFVASRNTPEELADQAKEVYDAAYFVEMGLELKILALENPELSEILSKKSKEMLSDADELFGAALDIVGWK